MKAFLIIFAFAGSNLVTAVYFTNVVTHGAYVATVETARAAYATGCRAHAPDLAVGTCERESQDWIGADYASR